MHKSVCLLVVLALAGGALAGPPCNHHEDYLFEVGTLMPDLIDDQSGYTSLVVKGRKAYAIYDGEYRTDHLQIIDLADEDAPVMRGQLLLDANVRNQALAAIDHYMLLVTVTDLRVIDVDDHDSPIEVVRLAVAGPRSVVVQARHAYLALASGEIRIYDVDDPAAPLLLDTVTAPFTTNCLVTTGDRLLVGGDNGLAIYSLAYPATPVLLGSISVPQDVHTIGAEGDIAVIAGDEFAHVVNIADPTAPVIVAWSFTDRVRACAIRDGVAWIGRDITGGGGRLDRWSLVDAAAPVLVGRDTGRGTPQAVQFALGNVYSAGWGSYDEGCELEGLHVYRDRGPASPPRLGFLDLNHEYSYGGGSVRGDLLYLVGETRLGVIDLSDPAAPTLVGSTSSLGQYWGQDCLVVGEHLIVRAWAFDFSRYWLQIYDLSDPLAPQQAPTPDHSGGISARDDLLYISDGSGVDVLRMLPTAELEPVGSFWETESVGPPMFGETVSAIVHESRAIRLVTFDGPAEPVLRGSIPAPGGNAWRWPRAIANQYVFVHHDPPYQFPLVDSWEIWDTADPATPILIHAEDLAYQDSVHDMTVRDGVLYVSDSRKITVWDVTDPAAPVHLGDRPHTGNEYRSRLHPLADHLLLTTYLGNVATLPYQCPLVTAVADDTPLELAPAQLTLTAAPNPFNPRTQVTFALPAASAVNLTLYDLRGRRVRSLVRGELPAGSHTATWNGRDEQGRVAAAGVYLARIVAGNRQATTRLVLVR